MKKIIGIFIVTLLITTSFAVSINLEKYNNVKVGLNNSETIDFNKFSSYQINSFDVNIVKPEKALYLNDEKIIPLFFATIIIGSITVEAEVSGATAEKVEFYVDDELRYTDYSDPFTWKWKEEISLKHSIKVKAYDQTESFAEKTTNVWIFNKEAEIIPPKVWMTDPLPTDLLYEPTWEIAVVTEEKIGLSAVQIGGSEEIAHTVFEYSFDGNEWTYIDMDTTGEFQGFVFEEEENPPWYGGNKRIGDEGWKTEWNNSGFSEGDYFLRATMTDITGTSGSCIRKIHIDRTPPKPIIESPYFGEKLSGIVEFRASSHAQNIVSMEVLLFHGSPGWFNQTGLGNARQNPGDGGICAPTAAANALAGLGEKKIYPPGQEGNDSAVQEELIDDMGTDKKTGTNIWRDLMGPFLPPETARSTTDQMGDALKALLEKKGIGCSNESGYDVKVYGVTLSNISGTLGIVPNTNEITFEEYTKQIRLKQAVILVWADFEAKSDSLKFNNNLRITLDNKSHAVTGRGTNSEKDYDGYNKGSVMDTNGENKTFKWSNMSDGGGGNVSVMNIDGDWRVLTGMWVICPKNKDAVVHSLGFDMNPENGFAVETDTTSLEEDGTFTFIIKMTDSDGFIGTDAIVVDIDNNLDDDTPPDVVITDPLDGSVVTDSVVTFSGYADDGSDGSGVALLDYYLEWDGGDYDGPDHPIDPPEEYISFELGPIDLENFIEIGDWISITTFATDAAGNTGTDTVTVTWEEEEDNTPPITEKTIGEPQWEEGYTIASYTPIWLEATDPEPGSGVHYIHYEIWQEGIQMDSEEIPDDYVELTFGMHGVISGIAEIRWYAVDYAENVEEMHYQEHFILY